MSSQEVCLLSFNFSQDIYCQEILNLQPKCALETSIRLFFYPEALSAIFIWIAPTLKL